MLQKSRKYGIEFNVLAERNLARAVRTALSGFEGSFVANALAVMLYVQIGHPRRCAKIPSHGYAVAAVPLCVGLVLSAILLAAITD